MPADLNALRDAYRNHHAAGSPTVAEYVAALEAELARTKADLEKTRPLVEATENFAEWAAEFVDDEGWSSGEQKASIQTWFGPSEFRDIKDAYEGCPAHLKPATPTQEELSKLVQKAPSTIAIRSPDSDEAVAMDLDQATLEAILDRASEIVCEGTSRNEKGYGAPYGAPWHIVDRHYADPEVNFPGEVVETLEAGQDLWSQRQEALMRARVAAVSEFLIKRNPAPQGMVP